MGDNRGRVIVLYDIIESPLGRLLLTGNGTALTGLYMLDAGARSYQYERQSETWRREPAAFEATAKELAEYFRGERETFTVPMAPAGTAFQLAVWEQLTKIPYGVTKSYGDIALALGKSAVASRAVGLANGSNPISIIIPCHRVIGADGSLTGYGWGLDRKQWLLRHEGALLL
jgi:methylated-DNA-[protein]-cysteine S-methyltransferase